MMPRTSPTFVLLLAASLTLGAATACASRPKAADQHVSDPGVAHVHGLGVDPADGMLYAATHYGLFRLPLQGRATRIADRYQDTMGFTITGPHAFLGSGHPDMRKDPQLPARLGLIQQAETVVSVGGDDGMQSPIHQHFAQNPAIRGVVIDD